MQSIPQGNKQQWTPPQGKYNLLKPLSSTQSPLGDSHPPKRPHMTDPTTNTNDTLVLRTQKEKPPHTAISSGPAASSADARKNKKKRNSKSPPTNKMTNLTQPREPSPHRHPEECPGYEHRTAEQPHGTDTAPPTITGPADSPCNSKHKVPPLAAVRTWRHPSTHHPHKLPQ